MLAAPRKLLRILIAEDDPNDRKLLALAVRPEAFAEFHVVEDGHAVLEYLQGEAAFADRREFPFPDLVVLDLKMPLLDGLDVLKWIRQESDWPRLPVVLLSGSGLDKDVEEAYRLGVNAYFQKPHSLKVLNAVLEAIAHYWTLAERPKRRWHQKAC